MTFFEPALRVVPRPVVRDVVHAALGPLEELAVAGPLRAPEFLREPADEAVLLLPEEPHLTVTSRTALHFHRMMPQHAT